MDRQLRERYEQMADEALLDVVRHQPDQYTEAARDAARTVLRERGYPSEELVPLVAEEAGPRRRATSSYLLPGVLVAIWSPATWAIVDEIRAGKTGGIFFFLAMAIVLTVLAVWASSHLGGRERPK